MFIEKENLNFESIKQRLYHQVCDRLQEFIGSAITDDFLYGTKCLIEKEFNPLKIEFNINYFNYELMFVIQDESITNYIKLHYRKLST